MSANRITRGFAWNHLYKIVEYGGVNLYAILVVRKFGPEIGGNYAVFLSISGTLAILGAFAVDGVLLRYLPRIARGERTYGSMEVKGIRSFLIELLAFRILVNLILGAIIFLVLAILPNYSAALRSSLEGIRELWPYFIVYLFGQAIVAFSTYTLLGLLQVKWVFYASLLTRSALIAAGFIFVLSNHLTLSNAVALYSGATIINAALLLYWVNRHVERESSDGLRKEFTRIGNQIVQYVRTPMRVRLFLIVPFMLYGITTWGNDILSTVLGRQPDILMMRAMLGVNSPDIGLYDAAARLAMMTEYIALFGLGGTLVSVFSELAHEDETNPMPVKSGTKTTLHYPRLRKARQDISGYQTVATGPFFAFMIVFSPLVLETAYGPRFSGAQPMILASLILQAITVILFGGGMNITSLVAIGKERVVFINRLCWGVFNLGVNYFLIRRFGGLGAIIGTQFSNAGACATESFFTSRWIGQSLRPLRSMAILATIALSVLLTYGIAMQLPPMLSPIFRLLIDGFCMAAITVLGYLLFRIPEAQTVYRKLRSLLGNSEPAAVSNA